MLSPTLPPRRKRCATCTTSGRAAYRSRICPSRKTTSSRWRSPSPYACRAEAETIFAAQLARTENPDNRRKLEFIAPSLSADESVRDAFFASLAEARQREVEPWVLDALENLHHPLRIAQSENYLLPSLELLEEIQTTGDIFFPSRWLDATLAKPPLLNRRRNRQRFSRREAPPTMRNSEPRSCRRPIPCSGRTR